MSTLPSPGCCAIYLAGVAADGQLARENSMLVIKQVTFHPELVELITKRRALKKLKTVNGGTISGGAANYFEVKGT